MKARHAVVARLVIGVASAGVVLGGAVGATAAADAGGARAARPVVSGGAAGALAGASAARTARPAVGGPAAPAPLTPWAMTIKPGSYRLYPMRVADPDGGPPWGMATYLADRMSAMSASVRGTLCTTVGRVVAGQLGTVDGDGRFHPILPGQRENGCGGTNPLYGDRSSGWGLSAVSAIEERCTPVTPPPGAPPADPPPGQISCADLPFRTAFTISLGRGILSAAMQQHGQRRWQPLQDGGDGTFLAVLPGMFTDRTMPKLRVRATLCGPDARRDLFTEPGAHRSGRCEMATVLP
jgi:hypothetical protein